MGRWWSPGRRERASRRDSVRAGIDAVGRAPVRVARLRATPRILYVQESVLEELGLRLTHHPMTAVCAENREDHGSYYVLELTSPCTSASRRRPKAQPLNAQSPSRDASRGDVSPRAPARSMGSAATARKVSRARRPRPVTAAPRPGIHPASRSQNGCSHRLAAFGDAGARARPEVQTQPQVRAARRWLMERKRRHLPLHESTPASLLEQTLGLSRSSTRRRGCRQSGWRTAAPSCPWGSTRSCTTAAR